MQHCGEGSSRGRCQRGELERAGASLARYRRRGGHHQGMFHDPTPTKAAFTQPSCRTLCTCFYAGLHTMEPRDLTFRGRVRVKVCEPAQHLDPISVSVCACAFPCRFGICDPCSRMPHLPQLHSSPSTSWESSTSTGTQPSQVSSSLAVRTTP